MMPTKREVERIFRNAGLSCRQAKAVIAKGYVEGLRGDLSSEAIAEAEAYFSEPSSSDRVGDLLIRAEMLASSH